MQPIFADYVASIADFKQNADSVLEQAQTASVLILTHNQPSTYLIPATEYEALLERLEDYELSLLAKPTFSNEMNGGFRTSTHPTLAKGF